MSSISGIEKLKLAKELSSISATVKTLKSGIEKLKAAKRISEIRAVLGATTIIPQNTNKPVDIDENGGNLEPQITQVSNMNIQAENGFNYKSLTDKEIESSEGYSKISGNKEALEYWQDVLDSFFGQRLVDVRNALRELGWDNKILDDGSKDRFTLVKGGGEFTYSLVQVGGGANVVGATYEINGYKIIVDDLSLNAAQVAEKLNSEDVAERPWHDSLASVRDKGKEAGYAGEPNVIPSEIAGDDMKSDIWNLGYRIGVKNKLKDAPIEITPDPIIEPETITPATIEPEAKPVEVADYSEIGLAKTKLKGLMAYQEQMKTVNKILKSSKLSDEQKKEQIMATGLGEAGYRSVMKPNYMGKIGYESWQLTNNNATIKNTVNRIAELESRELAAAKASSGDKETSYEFDGGSVELNYGADRLQVFFDTKPGSEMISNLKSSGYNWSPTNSAWQRKLTDNAIYSANRMFGLSIKTAASEMRDEINKPVESVIAAPEVVTNETQGNPIKDAFEVELNSLQNETDIAEFDKRMDEIYARIEKAGLAEEMDGILNETADVLTRLLAEAEAG